MRARARAEAARPPAGFTMIELMCVIVLAAIVLGVAGVLCVRAHERCRSVSRSTTARIDLAHGIERLKRDIREARAVAAGEGSLVLTRADGARVTWSVQDGQFLRSAPEAERGYGAGVEGLQVRTSGKNVRTTCVELVLSLREGAAVRSVYVGARTRLQGEKR